MIPDNYRMVFVRVHRKADSGLERCGWVCAPKSCGWDEAETRSAALVARDYPESRFTVATGHGMAFHASDPIFGILG